MPKANKGKRIMNLPEAASYSRWSFERGVEHGIRVGRQEILDALEHLSAEIKQDIERVIHEKKQNS